MIFSRRSCFFRTRYLQTKWASCWWTPWTRRFVLVALAVYVLTFCFVLPFLCRDLPLTKYYALLRDPKDTILMAKGLSRVHADDAEKRLASLPMESTKQMYEESMRKQNLRFAIAVQTVDRSGLGGPPPRYLTQVMVALHDVLQKSGGLEDTALFICNAQRPSKTHTEALDLSMYFPMVETSQGQEFDEYEREKQDYIFCLREAQKLSAEYILLLEDDALPHKDFYLVLDYVLKHKIETRIRQGILRSDQLEFAWLKLNIPTNLVKYERNYFFALEWITNSLILATLGILIIESIRKCVYRGMTPYKGKMMSLTTLFLVCFVYCLLLTFVLGRPYINLPLTLSKAFYRLGPGTSCCTQAMLYPHNRVSGIISYLETNTLDQFNPLDFALEDLRTEWNLPQFLICPNLFSHIGIISALRGRSNSRVAENYLFMLNSLRSLLPDWFAEDYNP